MKPKLPCERLDPELWFPVGITGPAQLQADEAKRWCETCPIQIACLEYALTHNVEYGVWGGQSEQERRATIRRGGGRWRYATEPKALADVLA